MIRGRGLIVVIAPLVVAALVACRDREQQAAIDGASARSEVARACASAGVDTDGGEPEPELHLACLDARCRDRCAAYAGTHTFQRTCVDACSAEGACSTDADCAAGLRCIAIAPVVRRCTSPR